MKLVFQFLLISIFITNVSQAYGHSGHSGDHTLAQTATSSAKPTAEKNLLNDQIKRLKDKIATKVAEISKSSKQVLAGTIQSINNDTITILSEGKTVKAITDSEVTKYLNLVGVKKIGVENLKKGNYIVLTGVMLNNEFSIENLILQNQYEFLSGTVGAVNKQGYFIDVITTTQETLSIDIEKSTIQKKVNINKSIIETSGFADYKVGDRIQVVIQKREKETSRVPGIRTLIIPVLLATPTP